MSTHTCDWCSGTTKIPDGDGGFTDSDCPNPMCVSGKCRQTYVAQNGECGTCCALVDASKLLDPDIYSDAEISERIRAHGGDPGAIGRLGERGQR